MELTNNKLEAAVVTANGPTTFCQGNNVLLTATGGTSYVWSTGETTSTITVGTAGAYTVTVTDGSGCTETLNVNINTSGNVPEVNVDSLTWAGCAGNSSGGIYINI